MCVSENNVQDFAYILPQEELYKEVYLVIQDVLEMCWYKSLKFFCAATETARDVTQMYHNNKTVPLEMKKNQNID